MQGVSAVIRVAIGSLICVYIVGTSQLCADEPVDRVTKLIRDFTDGDDIARFAALSQLGRMGPAARRAEPELFKALGDGNVFLRGHAAATIVRIGADPQIIRPLLDDPDSSVRQLVAEALLAVHGDVASTAPVLFEMRHAAGGSGDVDKVFHALSPALARKVQSFVIECVRDEELDDTELQELTVLGPLDAGLVPHLVELFQKRLELRTDVAGLLLQIGPGAQQATPLLQDLPGDNDFKLALTATAALAAIVPENDEYIRLLSGALVGPYREQRELAGQLIDELGPRGAGAAGALVAAMTNEKQRPTDSFRQACATTLGKLGKAGVQAIEPALRQQPEPDACWYMVNALGTLGPDAEPATEALITIITGSDYTTRIRLEAINAIGAIGPSAISSAPALLDQLKTKSESIAVRGAAARALAEVGAHVDGESYGLFSLLDDPDPKVRLEFAVALLRFENDPKPAVSALGMLIDEHDPETCLAALHCLQDLGPRAKPAIPAVVKSLAFEKGVAMGFGGITLSTAAANCLSAIGAAAVPDLTRALDLPDARSRACAAEALGMIGDPAKSAVPALRGLLNDDRRVASQRGCMGCEQSIGECAFSVFGRIGPGASAAVPDLVVVLEREAARGNPSENGQLDFAVTILGRIGPAARIAAPRLHQLLDRDDVDLRLRATIVTALARMTPESPRLVPRLLQLLADFRDEAGSDSINYMGEFSELTEAIVAMTKLRRFFLADLSALCECNLLAYTYRLDAAFAALRIDAGSEPARRYLEWASRHSDWLIRDFAKEKLNALQQPGTSSK